MRISLAVLCTLQAALAFTVPLANMGPRCVVTSLEMFTGAGAGMPTEDNPDELAQMEQTAKAMGMTVEEYKLGIQARMVLQKELDEAICVGGDPSTIAIERDGHNPPKTLKVIVTDAGKALGKEKLSEQLVSAMKASAAKSKDTRAGAQKKMMAYIGEEMKKLGA